MHQVPKWMAPKHLRNAVQAIGYFFTTEVEKYAHCQAGRSRQKGCGLLILGIATARSDAEGYRAA
jgi:hypothetical protein